MLIRDDDKAFVPGGARDGHWLLHILSLGLVLSGLFALFLGITGRFLPHDEQYLGMTAADLCSLHGCRIVHFMVHDRVSFGGAVVAVGVLYLWLVRSPLHQGQAWAWWLVLISGAIGFGSFFAYLGYGYLDTWHGLATLGLLSCFVLGLAQARRTLGGFKSPSYLLQPSLQWPTYAAARLGRACLLFSAAGLVAAGLIILVVGMTCVFVPQDLRYMGVDTAELQALNPRLVPLIAHDRAGFGGAVCCCGVALFFCVWCGSPSGTLWGVLAAVGLAGFGPAIAIHPAVGYDDAFHIAPAVFDALVYLAGMLLSFRPMTVGLSPPGPVPGVRNPEGSSARLPSLQELGPGLLGISPWRKLLALFLPFGWCGAYFTFAALDWWPLAVFSLVALSFVTYGSTSHDLVHRSLGLPRALNDILLCVIELLALRSGHAYQAAHLHHHARYPNPDDIEAAAARRSWLGALAEGIVFQFRIWLWAVRNARRARSWVIGEATLSLALAALAVALFPLTPVPLVYVALMVAGAWVIPLVTSYLPHTPEGQTELRQTRAFRGWIASILALGHLYHLEHHLYPAVPHQNWPTLAKRLDPYLEEAGVTPITFWF
jgi:fatty acid desaturase